MCCTRPLIALVASLVALGGCGSTASKSEPTPVVSTGFPGLAAPSEPGLPALAAGAPGRGRVGRIAGPFDDRFRLTAVRFDGIRVLGRIAVTSDVSDTLELQVLADFYDRSGKLIGRGRFTHHLDEDAHHDKGRPNEHRRFDIAVPPSLRAEVRSAAIGVPVLVNE